MPTSSATKADSTEPAISQEAYASDLLLLRLSLGLVYFLFGFLKLFPDLSPAELLGSQTIMRMSGYQMGADLALRSLAVMEVLIGIGFILNICLRWVSIIFFAHMAGTFLPLFLLPELTFKYAPFAPTIEGQYILKNLVFLAAGWAILLPVIRKPKTTQSTDPDTQAGKQSKP